MINRLLRWLLFAALIAGAYGCAKSSNNGNMSARTVSAYKGAFSRPASECANEATSASWSSLGKAAIDDVYYGKVGGRVNGIILNKDGSVVIASADGGLWRGAGPDPTRFQWAAVGDKLSSLSFGALAGNGATLYAASGEGNYYCGDCSPGSDIFMSNDSGKTWVTLSSSPVKYATSLRVSASKNGAVTLWLAGAEDASAKSSGVFVAKNVCSNRNCQGLPFGTDIWQQVNVGADSDHPADIAIDSSDPDRARVLVADSKGIVALEPGVGWQRVLQLPPDDQDEAKNNPQYVGRIAIAPSNARIVYALFAFASYDTQYSKRGLLKGIYRSDNGGRYGTWQKLNGVTDIFATAPGAPGQGTYDQALVVDPNDPRKAYAGGIGIIESRDGGNTWSQLEAADVKTHAHLHSDQHAFAVDDKGFLYVGNDGGLVRINPVYGSMDNLSAGLNVTEFYQGGSASADNAVLLAGSQDNGSEQLSLTQPLGVAWRAIERGDGAFTAINDADRNQEYIEQPHGVMEVTKDAQDLRPQWTDLTVKYLDSLFYMPFFVDPRHWNEIYAGADGVYKSVDGGATWTNLTQTDPKWSPAPLVVALAVANSGQTIVAARNDHLVAVSPDGGGSWSTHPVRGDYVRAVTISGNDAYVATRFQDDSYSEIYEIKNAATQPQWQMIQPRAPLVNVIFRYEDKLLIGTDVGVFQLHQDGSVDGCPFGEGLPQLPVRDLVETPNKRLVALTHGRGAWMITP